MKQFTGERERAERLSYPPMNSAPPRFDPARDLPPGFVEFVTPLDREFTPRQERLVARRRERLAAAHRGELPDYLPAAAAPPGSGAWRVDLPDWCKDQRNQMTGPADDAELVVKMLHSGAPGVTLA